MADTRNQLASMTGPIHTATYTYEPGRNAMTGVENKETVGTESVVSNYTYTYNALGQRADREQSGTAFAATTTDSFTYDYLGQVTASANDTETGIAWNPSYAYDEIGNRSGNTVDLNGTTGYTQDLLNQYTVVGSDTPSYDADGNLTGKGAWTYFWNGENRLSSATNGILLLEFTYDYQGRLVRQVEKTENQTTGNWETDDEVVYVYDGWNRIASFDVGSSTFDVQRSYLWGLDLSGSMQGAGGVGGLLSEKLHSSPVTTHYSLYDANGNIVQKLNASGGTDMAVAYDPFGNVIDGTLVGEYGFSTKPFVGGILMYYYGFRYYDPVTGRWPSRDPFEEKGGLNLYGFVENDPVNLWDLLGMAAGDEYGNYSDAKSAAVDDVYDLTAQDVTSGRAAALAWQKLNLQNNPPLDWSDTNWVIAQQSGSWTAVYGREYATYVYKFKNSSGDFKWTYSDPSRFVGTMPSVQQFKDGTYGITTVLGKSEIDSKDYADSGISKSDACEVKAIVHTHSMTIVGIDNPDRSISADDEIYANDVGFRIIAVKPDKVLEEYAP